MKKTNTIKAKIKMSNSNDLADFVECLNKCPAFTKLSHEEKLKIACAYPIRTKVIF